MVCNQRGPSPSSFETNGPVAANPQQIDCVPQFSVKCLCNSFSSSFHLVCYASFFQLPRRSLTVAFFWVKKALSWYVVLFQRIGPRPILSVSCKIRLCMCLFIYICPLLCYQPLCRRRRRETKVLVLLSASVERFFVSRMQDFLKCWSLVLLYSLRS